jgi:hypothetical protein
MSFDPTQQPGPNQGPYYEYSDYSYNPYGAPQDPYAAAYAAPPAAPLPLGQAVQQLFGQYWRVLSRPGALTFAAEAGKAAWDIISVQLIGYAIIAALLSAANAVITRASTLAVLNQLNQLNGTGGAGGQPPALNISSSPGLSIVTSLAGTLIGFFIGQGILFGLAKAFGGQGTFTQQAYVFLLFQVPLGILEGLLALIPIVGGFIALAGSIYEIVLAVFAIMGVHRLSGGKASAVVLIPIGVLLLLACCAVFFLVAAIVNNPNFH